MLVYHLPLTRPNGPKLASMSGTLVIYLAILYRGLTPKRVFWLSLLSRFGDLCPVGQTACRMDAAATVCERRRSGSGSHGILERSVLAHRHTRGYTSRDGWTRYPSGRWCSSTRWRQAGLIGLLSACALANVAFGTSHGSVSVATSPRQPRRTHSSTRPSMKGSVWA